MFVIIISCWHNGKREDECNKDAAGNNSHCFDSAAWETERLVQTKKFLPSHIGLLFDWQRWYYTNSVFFPLIFIFTRVSILIRLCCCYERHSSASHEGWSRFTARFYRQIDQLPRMILCFRSSGNKNHETEMLARILIKPQLTKLLREGSAGGERTVLTGRQMDINLFGRRELMEVIKSDSELKCSNKRT